MKPVLTDWPRPVAQETYRIEFNRMTRRLSALEGLVSVCQLGSVRHPGISDVDLVCVFEDGASCPVDPIRGATGVRRYIFAHALFGTSRSHFAGARRYSGLYGFHRISGEELPVLSSFKEGGWEEPLKVQVALEFLIRMYVNLVVARTYSVYRVRSLLLQVRALRFDLELLGVSRGELADHVARAEKWRERWFEKPPARRELLAWAGDLTTVLEDFIEERLQAAKFFAPGGQAIVIAPNMTLEPGDRLGYSHRGVVLPPRIGGLGKRMANLQNRWNRFTFRVPMDESDTGTLRAKTEYDREVRRYNLRHLPHFIPLTSPLRDRRSP